MRTFDISVARDAVAVKQGEQAILTFTVTNVSGRDLRALARLVPENDEHMDWLRIEGEGRREVQNAQSDTIVVKIKPPQGAPPGAGRFRLVVANEENPDEDFAQAVARFAVEPGGAPEPKARPWWPIAAAAAVVVAVAVIAVLLSLERKITMPDVKGKTFEQAKSELGDAGFRQAPEEVLVESSEHELGKVFEQEPEHDKTWPADTPIRLTVAQPLPPVPPPVGEVYAITDVMVTDNPEEVNREYREYTGVSVAQPTKAYIRGQRGVRVTASNVNEGIRYSGGTNTSIWVKYERLRLPEDSDKLVLVDIAVCKWEEPRKPNYVKWAQILPGDDWQAASGTSTETDINRTKTRGREPILGGLTTGFHYAVYRKGLAVKYMPLKDASTRIVGLRLAHTPAHGEERAGIDIRQLDTTTTEPTRDIPSLYLMKRAVVADLTGEPE